MPATSWAEAPIEETRTTTIIDHLRKHGALDAAERVMDHLDNDSDDAPLASPDEVRARMAKYCR